MQVAVTGSSGLIGTALAAALRADGHRVIRLVRAGPAAPDHGFLPELVRDWEAAAGEPGSAGIRVVTLRSGIVLSRRGGMLGRLLPLFRLGLGGKLGSGRQMMSWIGLSDWVAAARF